MTGTPGGTSARRGRARWPLGLALAAVAVAAVAIVAVALGIGRSSDQPDEVSASFCQTFGELDDGVAQVERVVAGEPEPGDQDLETLRGVAALVWGERVADGGPAAARSDARIVAGAVRAAVEAGDPAPLRDDAVRAAIERVGPVAEEACAGRGP